MRRTLSILFAFALLPACSGSMAGLPGDGPSSPPGSQTSTSEVVPETIAGVCAKYDLLACAMPNCMAQLTLGQQECSLPSDNFQGLIDCLSVATITCAGNPVGPQVPECNGDLQRLSLCTSGGEVPLPGNDLPTSDAGAPMPAPAPAGECQSSASCTAWSCLCADGFNVSLAECSNGVCQGPTYVCSASSPSTVSACQGHGGVL
jgi:hypothetical protein